MDENKVKQLAAAMAIEDKLARDEEVSAFKADIFMESNSVSGGVEFGRVYSELLGKQYDDWFDETAAMVESIITEQTRKLNRMLCDFFGEEPESVEIYPTATAEKIRRRKDEQ